MNDSQRRRWRWMKSDTPSIIHPPGYAAACQGNRLEEWNWIICSSKLDFPFHWLMCLWRCRLHCLSRWLVAFIYALKSNWHPVPSCVAYFCNLLPKKGWYEKKMQNNLKSHFVFLTKLNCLFVSSGIGMELGIQLGNLRKTKLASLTRLNRYESMFIAPDGHIHNLTNQPTNLYWPDSHSRPAVKSVHWLFKSSDFPDQRLIRESQDQRMSNCC